MRNRVAAAQRDRLIETGDGRVELTHLLERKAAVAIWTRAAWLNCNSPIEKEYRLRKVAALAGQDPERIERVEVIRMAPEQSLIEGARRRHLTLLLQQLGVRELLLRLLIG
jgi:hypothetical protein